MASAPSSNNAMRQTSRSRRLSRSRSEGTEGGSTESPTRGVDILTIWLCLEGVPNSVDLGEGLAQKLWGLSPRRATQAQGPDSEVVKRVWRCNGSKNPPTRMTRSATWAFPRPPYFAVQNEKAHPATLPVS